MLIQLPHNGKCWGIPMIWMKAYGNLCPYLLVFGLNNPHFPNVYDINLSASS